MLPQHIEPEDAKQYSKAMIRFLSNPLLVCECPTCKNSFIDRQSQKLRNFTNKDISREYDDKKQVVREEHFDVKGEPIAFKDGYFILLKEYTEAGKVSREDYLDADGNPMLKAGGFAAVQVRNRFSILFLSIDWNSGCRFVLYSVMDCICHYLAFCKQNSSISESISAFQLSSLIVIIYVLLSLPTKL